MVCHSPKFSKELSYAQFLCNSFPHTEEDLIEHFASEIVCWNTVVINQRAVEMVTVDLPITEGNTSWSIFEAGSKLITYSRFKKYNLLLVVGTDLFVDFTVEWEEIFIITSLRPQELPHIMVRHTRNGFIE